MSDLNRLVFCVSGKPHPNIRHLSTRLFTYARVVEYTEDRIVLEMKAKNLEYVSEYVSNYLRERNVSYNLWVQKEVS
jgi:hypothetical protein